MQERTLTQILLDIDTALSVLDRMSPKIIQLLKDEDKKSEYRTSQKTEEAYTSLFALSQESLRKTMGPRK